MQLGIRLPIIHENDSHYILKLYATRRFLCKSVAAPVSSGAPARSCKPVKDSGIDWQTVQTMFRFLLAKRNQYAHGYVALQKDLIKVVRVSNQLVSYLIGDHSNTEQVKNDMLSDAMKLYKEVNRPWTIINKLST
jgi:hypothetical protein